MSCTDSTPPPPLSQSLPDTGSFSSSGRSNPQIPPSCVLRSCSTVWPGTGLSDGVGLPMPAGAASTPRPCPKTAVQIVTSPASESRYPPDKVHRSPCRVAHRGEPFRCRADQGVRVESRETSTQEPKQSSQTSSVKTALKTARSTPSFSSNRRPNRPREFSSRGPATWSHARRRCCARGCRLLSLHVRSGSPPVGWRDDDEYRARHWDATRRPVPGSDPGSGWPDGSGRNGRGPCRAGHGARRGVGTRGQLGPSTSGQG